jgi:hypothetical protein
MEYYRTYWIIFTAINRCPAAQYSEAALGVTDLNTIGAGQTQDDTDLKAVQKVIYTHLHRIVPPSPEVCI